MNTQYDEKRAALVAEIAYWAREKSIAERELAIALKAKRKKAEKAEVTIPAVVLMPPVAIQKIIQ